MRILIYAIIYCTASFFKNHQYSIIVTTLTNIEMVKTGLTVILTEIETDKFNHSCHMIE
jgi:hypothetical protein